MGVLFENFERKYSLEHFRIAASIAQQTFTCSESTIETLEKDVKYVQS